MSDTALSSLSSYTEYEPCRVCPRNCGIVRNALHTEQATSTRGICGETALLRIATASIHFGEEPPVTGIGGSGTIFISGCNLRCVFCQNHQISQGGMGAVVSKTEFIAICLELQKRGAENINIVTGTHATPVLADYLGATKKEGLTIPILWNTSSYESIESLDLLAPYIDGYLPDLKTFDSALSKRLFCAADYPSVAEKAIRWMADHSSFVIMRHLVLPDNLEDTKRILYWFRKTLYPRVQLSLMTQFTPAHQCSPHSQSLGTLNLENLNRYIEQDEFDTLELLLDDLDLTEGFYQELVQDSSWLPDFNCTNPFSSDLSQPVWHWKTGFVS